MKQKLIVANLKMYLSSEAQIRAHVEALCEKGVQSSDAIQCVICPPTLFVRDYGRVLEHGFACGVQNLFWERSGAFTSGISPQSAKESGVTYAIIGHSERRAHMGETDEMVGKKVVAAIANDIIPIICVGESLAMRGDGSSFDFIEAQVRGALAGVSARVDPAKIVFAYEPVWAISANRTDAAKTSAPQITTNDVMTMRLHIYKTVTEIFDRTTAEHIRILYGGSVSPQTVQEFCIASEMDGALVGSASTDVKKFLDIAQQF